MVAIVIPLAAGAIAAMLGSLYLLFRSPPSLSVREGGALCYSSVMGIMGYC